MTPLNPCMPQEGLAFYSTAPWCACFAVMVTHGERSQTGVPSGRHTRSSRQVFGSEPEAAQLSATLTQPDVCQIGSEERLNCYYAQTQEVAGHSLQVGTVVWLVLHTRQLTSAELLCRGAAIGSSMTPQA